MRGRYPGGKGRADGESEERFPAGEPLLGLSAITASNDASTVAESIGAASLGGSVDDGASATAGRARAKQVEATASDSMAAESSQSHEPGGCAPAGFLSE